ncbi:MAG TPA: hypothetical protein VGF99_09225 [Myxococcota bacterium]
MTDAAAPIDTLEARLLADKAKRPRLLDDCVRLIDAEVDSKGGLSGMVIKGAYKVVGAVKPGFIKEAMDHLLDDFVKRLEPFYAQHRDLNGGDPTKFGSYLSSHRGDVADALLGITDDRARNAKNPNIKATYNKLRPEAKKHVEEAIPRVGSTLSKHL